MLSYMLFYILLIGSLVGLGLGVFCHTRNCHLYRIAGWISFGLFWLNYFPSYVTQNDAINAFASGGAIIAFSFIAYHEYKSYLWNEEYEPLRFIAGTAFLAATIYFLIDRIPVLSAGLINIVAQHSAGLLNIFTHPPITAGPYAVSRIDYAGNPPWYRVNESDIQAHLEGTSVSIILACTGLQAIVVAAACILSTHARIKKKIEVFAVISVVVYVANIARNAILIYATDYEIFGENSFEIAHNYIGKVGISLGVLTVLVFYAFLRLPEFYENINGIFELPWRKKPGHDYKKYIGRLYDMASFKFRNRKKS